LPPERTLEDILKDDPFETDSPTKYEVYLQAALKMAFANIHAMTVALAKLETRIDQHEQMHRAANVAAIAAEPEKVKDEKPN
jgi:hypothetical protein